MAPQVLRCIFGNLAEEYKQRRYALLTCCSAMKSVGRTDDFKVLLMYYALKKRLHEEKIAWHYFFGKKFTTCLGPFQQTGHLELGTVRTTRYWFPVPRNLSS